MLEVRTEWSMYCIDVRRKLLWRHPSDLANAMPEDFRPVSIEKMYCLRVGHRLHARLRYSNGLVGERLGTEVLSIKSNIHIGK